MINMIGHTIVLLPKRLSPWFYVSLKENHLWPCSQQTQVRQANNEFHHKFYWIAASLRSFVKWISSPNWIVAPVEWGYLRCKVNSHNQFQLSAPCSKVNHLTTGNSIIPLLPISSFKTIIFRSESFAHSSVWSLSCSIELNLPITPCADNFLALFEEDCIGEALFRFWKAFRALPCNQNVLWIQICDYQKNLTSPWADYGKIGFCV